MRRIGLMEAAGMAVLAFAPVAAAQKPPAGGAFASESQFYGRWDGVVDWSDDSYDSPLWFEFYADGTFTDPSNEGGTWETTANGIRIIYATGGMTVYHGTFIADMIVGTMATNPPTLNGVFALRRSN